MIFRSSGTSTVLKAYHMRSADLSHTLLHNFTRCYSDRQCTVIQVLNREFTTSKRRQELDLDVGHEVVFVALEAFMRFLLDNNDDIAWNNAGRLIAFSSEGDC